MSEVHYLHGNDYVFPNGDNIIIPVIFSSDCLIYDITANTNLNQVGKFLLSEFIHPIGWVIINRLDAFQGKNFLIIDYSFGSQYRLIFSPANLRSATLAITLKIWRIDMPLSRSGNVSVSGSQPSTNVNLTTVASSTNSAVILAPNADRKGATIWNNSTATLYLELDSAVDSSASASKFTVSLSPNDYYEIPYVYTGRIVGVWSAANGSAFVREFV